MMLRMSRNDGVPSLESETGLAKSTIYQRIAKGLFPKPVQLGGGIVGWPSREIDTVISAIIAGKSQSEMKTLVRELEIGRKHAA